MFEMKLLLITNTIYLEKLGEVQVHSHGGQWREIVMFMLNGPFPAIFTNKLSDLLHSKWTGWKIKTN